MCWTRPKHQHPRNENQSPDFKKQKQKTYLEPFLSFNETIASVIKTNIREDKILVFLYLKLKNNSDDLCILRRIFFVFG